MDLPASGQHPGDGEQPAQPEPAIGPTLDVDHAPVGPGQRRPAERVGEHVVAGHHDPCGAVVVGHDPLAQLVGGDDRVGGGPGAQDP